MTRFVYALLLVGLLGTFPVRGADDLPKKLVSIEGVTEYRLPNGLRVLLMLDGSKPLIHVHCTVRVGSRHEGYGEAGMAHLLEHMLCKGTATHPDIMRSLRDRGAVANADTTVDRTRYYETLPATDDNLEFAIGLEADRLVNTIVKRDELLTEMTVVRNEFERNENSAETILVERMNHAAFRWHNYGKTVLGNRADIERVPVENLQAFYKKHYRVDNAVLVVTGKFDEAKALGLVAKYFAPIPKPGPALTPTYTQEPAQDGERNVILRRAGTVASVGAVYHIPAQSHPDFPAIQALDFCLTSEPAGRLYKALVETKMAASVSGSAWGNFDPSIMVMTARVEDPARADAARDALLRTLESLADHPITDEEVERVRQRFTRTFERIQASAEAMADQLDEFTAVGDWRLFFLERDRCEKVTAADVNRVARAYLVRNNRTVGIYYPTKHAERVAIPEAPNLSDRLAGYSGRAATVAAATFDPTPENIEKRVVRGTLGPIKTAFLQKATRGDLMYLTLNLHYGNEQTLTGRTMAANLLPDMLQSGTKAHARQQFWDEIARLGSSVSVGGSPGLLQVTVSAKKANLPATLGLVRELLREPAFPASEFDTLKREILTALAARKAEPGTLAGQAVQKKLRNYPKTDIRHYTDTEESVERLKALTLDDVKSIYSDLLGAQFGELVAVGEFDTEVVTTGLGPALAGWTSKIEYQRIVTPAKPVDRGETIKIETPDKANAIYFAALSFPMTDTDSDYPAMIVGTSLMGGNTFVSRLGARVRKEKGLTYGIDAGFSADSMDPSASFSIEATTNPANMTKVRETVAAELQKFVADGVTEEELGAGKKGFLEEFKVALSSDAVIAHALANGLYLNRTFAHQAGLIRKVEALTPADIQRAFKRVVDPAKLVIAEAGDFAGAEKKEGARADR
jgi:zinc protease